MRSSTSAKDSLTKQSSKLSLKEASNQNRERFAGFCAMFSMFLLASNAWGHHIPRCVPARRPNQVQRIKSPTLLLCGEKTLKIHQLVNDEPDRLLKGNKLAKRITIAQETHDMWSEQPEVCKEGGL
jgi:pimeloyl-ACP methyl ester carboxylesterase